MAYQKNMLIGIIWYNYKELRMKLQKYSDGAFRSP